MSKLSVQKVPTVDDRSLPVFGEIDKLAERIRQRAFELFADRNSGLRKDLDDWLLAEREICGPAAELTEHDGDFELDVALAGFDANDINLTATPKELIVKATHLVEHKKTGDADASTVRWSEFHSNDVCRRVELPQEVDVEKISAEFQNGLLKIVAPKAPKKAKSAKQVKISAS